MMMDMGIGHVLLLLLPSHGRRTFWHSPNTALDQNHRPDSGRSHDRYSASGKGFQFLRDREGERGMMGSRLERLAGGGPPTATAAPTGTDTIAYKCLRLPADGSPIERLDYATTSSIPKGSDSYFDVAADLRRYWHGDYLARQTQSFCVGENSLPALNGQYILYYGTDSSRPANKTLLSMPVLHDAIEKSTKGGEKFEERVFYRGDVFVVRLRDWWENTNFRSKHDDISPQLVQPLIQLLDEGLFAHNWRDKSLEYQRRLVESKDKHMQKHEYYRAKMMSGLSPAEQENPDPKWLIDIVAAMSALGAESEES